MRLKDYSRKRRFQITPEPPPGQPQRRRSARASRFVVQKHQASHLHYDFRLEWDGVLLSWAVPKGPSMDPAMKRLAMQVEDHPLEYADFEGVIPTGEYGGGTVMIWDRGTYVPEYPDVGEALRKGEIKFTLKGKKLKGGWVLVRTRGRSWLLIKRRDKAARGVDPIAHRPRSVASNRLMVEIAFDSGGDIDRAARGDPAAELRSLIRHPRRRGRVDPPAVWHSKEQLKGMSRRRAQFRVPTAARRSNALAGIRCARFQ